MAQQQKMNYLKDWLNHFNVDHKNICTIARIIMILIADLGHRCLAYQTFVLLFDYIKIKEKAHYGNGLHVHSQSQTNDKNEDEECTLFIKDILKIADLTEMDFKHHMKRIGDHLRAVNLLNMVDKKNTHHPCSPCSPCSPCAPSSPDKFLRTTHMYALFKIYFTTINSVLTDKLSNQKGINLQAIHPESTHTSNPEEMDLFDTGITKFADSHVNWRRRISTLSFIGSHHNGKIRRANANLFALKNKSNIHNIIDIIIAYSDAKNNLVSEGIKSDDAYVEGTSKRLNEDDMFVVVSGRFTSDCCNHHHHHHHHHHNCSCNYNPFTYMVIKVKDVHIKRHDNSDYYSLEVFRF